jgi:outer membrane lipoprotein-sorting protein
MTRRWLVVFLAAAALVVTPLAIRARPTPDSQISAADLAKLIHGSGAVGWSGFVQSNGTLQVPDSDSFANLSQLLSEKNNLRVWWRSDTDWRVDRIRSTGETDLFRRGNTSIRWVFESETATFSPVSQVRLPDASDLLPPSLGRSLLSGARDTEVSRLPARTVAGIDAPGLRLTPSDQATTVGHVDIWADARTGLALRVELYGLQDQRPTLSTSLVDVDPSTPAATTTRFTPSASATVNFDESVDVAASANAFAPYDLPATLGGLASRSGKDPGAVGVYGRGPTSLFVLPLRDQVARPLRRQLRESTNASRTDLGTLAPLGPVGLLITFGRGRASFLLAGTVTNQTLERAATELIARQ